MRIIFIDLHCDEFLVRHLGRIMGKNKVKCFKHQFILRYFLDNGYEVRNLITDKGTTAGFPYRKFTNMSSKCKLLESYFVEKKNKLPIIKSIDEGEIKPTDIVVGYLVKSYQLPIFAKIRCYKMIFGNHFISISQPLDLEELGINAFVNEIDLTNNNFVNLYIKNKKCDSIILPYVFAERFELKKDFKDRVNKLMAVGTASTCESINDQYILYRNHFHTNLIQLMRWEILEKKDKLKDYIDCYIGDIRSGSFKARTPIGLIDKILWRFQSRKIGNQADYTSFDMVETFNKYKMFVCPEELVGMPGIGAIEGMACGTAYIGIDHDMYKSLGLIPGIHYITYDGTLGGLINVIKEYQNRPGDVERIAKTGMEYVREHFNEKAIQESFISQLTNSYERYLDQLNND